MGITNLLPMFRSSTTVFDVTKFSGKRCAVDGFGWIHMAIRGCGRQLIKYANEPCDVYLHALMQKVEILMQNNIDVTIVFDGKPLPAKQRTQLGRRSTRQTHMEIAKKADEDGDDRLANKHYNLAVGVSHRIVANWMYLLQKVGCKFIVAPYEADAQLAYLARSGAIDFVITEDSDLIIYECPCIVFKFDRTGQGDLFYLSSLNHFTDDHLPMTPYILRQACILAMCDYFEGIPGLGIKGALKLVNAHSSVVEAIKFFCSTRPSLDAQKILEGYFLAESTFQHQVVLASNGQCMRLSEALGGKHSIEQLDFAGRLPYAEHESITKAVCVLGVGDVHTGFVPCKSDFEALNGMCSKCLKFCDKCHCERVDAHVWYRDALSCQASYDCRFVFDPTKKPPPEMAPEAPNVVFAQCRLVPPSRYKKRKVSYMTDADEQNDVDKNSAKKHSPLFPPE